MKIFDSELKVLEVLWEEGEMRASHICKILEEKTGWNRNTTYTIIKKCVQKGYIERKESHFVCNPLITKREVQKAEIKNLLNKLFHNSQAEFLEVLLEKEMEEQVLNEKNRTIL